MDDSWGALSPALLVVIQPSVARAPIGILMSGHDSVRKACDREATDKTTQQLRGAMLPRKTSGVRPKGPCARISGLMREWSDRAVREP